METEEFEQLTKNHKAIADFMEFIKEKNGKYTIIMGGVYTVRSPFAMNFNTDWNWLMPVIDKIYNLDQHDEEGNNVGDITHALVDIDIEETCKAVIKFIEWYNKQTK